MLGAAALTLGLTQVALAGARANVVVPCFTATSIILATGLGAAVLGEAVTPGQWVGVAVVVAGVVFLTAFKTQPAASSDSPGNATESMD
ncbi:MAG: hypothetical protein Kow0069_06790 [Promethearchaeota archaeon]